MTFRSLALSNVKGNWRAYSAFFLSSVFSVLIFYIYAAFLTHPDVVMERSLSRQSASGHAILPIYYYCVLIPVHTLFQLGLPEDEEAGIRSLHLVRHDQGAAAKARHLRESCDWSNGDYRRDRTWHRVQQAVLHGAGVLLDMKDTISFAIPFKALWLTAGSFFGLFPSSRSGRLCGCAGWKSLIC